MKNMKKMSRVLNLAKLARFQRTNQARINPIYDASLHVFSPKVAVKATGKTFPKNAKTIHARFSTPTHYLFPDFFIFFNAKRRLKVIFSIQALFHDGAVSPPFPENG
ncbi:MAG: hypothetical protein Q7J73_03175 [Dehalococcoidales bacterium]|nr:hypothetical protein [Dehalococcoidales bacterium]